MRHHSGHKVCGGKIIRHSHLRHLVGSGMGSVLLNRGGAGGGSSYPSIEQYEQITGNRIHSRGSGMESGLASCGRGLGAGLGEKLNKLTVKPFKAKASNIHFDF